MGNGRARYAFFIPHLGILLACLSLLLFASILFLWALARSSADYLICLNSTARFSLNRHEWGLALFKGLIVVPVLLFLLLTQQWLISSLLFAGVVVIFIGVFKAASLGWKTVVRRFQPEG